MSTEPMKLTACGTEFVNALDGKGWTGNGVWVGFEMNYVLSELHATRAEVAALKSAVDPVRSWFDGDGNINPPPTDADIARLAVEELQRDRDELLSLHAKLRVWRDPVVDAIRLSIMEISEANWFAGWLYGIEYRIWRDVTTGTRDECSDKEAANLGVLSKIVDGWVHWSSGVDGPTFVALDEWIARYEVWLSVDNARRAAEAKRPMSEIACKPESTPGTTAEPGSALRGLRFPEGPTLAEMKRLIDEASPHVPDGSITYLRGGPLKKGSLWCNARTGETKEWNGSRWVDGPPTKITVQPDGTKVVTVIGDAPGGCTVEGRIVEGGGN